MRVSTGLWKQREQEEHGATLNEGEMESTTAPMFQKGGHLSAQAQAYTRFCPFDPTLQIPQAIEHSRQKRRCARNRGRRGKHKENSHIRPSERPCSG